MWPLRAHGKPDHTRTSKIRSLYTVKSFHRCGKKVVRTSEKMVKASVQLAMSSIRRRCFFWRCCQDQTTIQQKLRFRIRTHKVSGQQLRQIHILAGDDLRHQFCRNRRESWTNNKQLFHDNARNRTRNLGGSE